MNPRLTLSPLGRLTRTALVAVSLGSLVAAAAGTATAAVPSRAVLDGPTRMYAIRTFDSGEKSTAAQRNACYKGLGPVQALTTISVLAARYYNPVVDPSTGLVTTAASREVSPLFGCVGVTGSTTQPGTSWGEVPLSLGTIHAKGNCSLRISSVQQFATESGCILGLTPENGLNGVVTSASYTDLLKLGSTTTGSVWTAMVTGAAGRSQPVSPAPTPAPDAPKQGNLRHLILRAIDQHSHAVPASCPAGTHTSTTAELHAQQPDPATDELIAAPSDTAAGTVVMCFASRFALAVSTTAIITLPAGPGAPAASIKIAGICYHRDIGQLPSMGEACDLSPTSKTAALQEGMVTSNGLVTAGTNGGAVNAPVWVIGGFGAIGTPAS